MACMGHRITAVLEVKAMNVVFRRICSISVLLAVVVELDVGLGIVEKCSIGAISHLTANFPL
jgi:hypothetical protein